MKLAITLSALALAACTSPPPPAPHTPIAPQVARIDDKVQIRAERDADRKALLTMAREACGSPAQAILYTPSGDDAVVIDYKCQPPGWVSPMDAPLKSDFAKD